MSLHHKQFPSDLYPGKLAQSMFISAVSKPMQGGKQLPGQPRGGQEERAEQVCIGEGTEMFLLGLWSISCGDDSSNSLSSSSPTTPLQICTPTLHPLQKSRLALSLDKASD